MHPQRKQRLIVVLFIVVFSSVAIGLMMFALRDNVNLFYPPSKIISGEAPINKRIRAGGCVLPGSVERVIDPVDPSSLRTAFIVTDGMAQLSVQYSGILPDLFAEGEAAVVNGMLSSDGVFMATQVLAKHDENYTPPEVAATMQQGNEHMKACEGMSYAS